MEDLFTIHQYPIVYEKINQVIELVPFGDVHWGSKSCAKDKFKEFCDRYRHKKNVYFLGTGDYIDLASHSERIILKDPKIHSTTNETLDDLYKKQAYEFCEKISFMKNRIIGMIEGNHYGLLQANVTTTQLVCQHFGCRYLGGSAFIKLSFSVKGEHRTRNSLKIWIHHGTSATKRIGGSILNVENMRLNAVADIYLAAHDHRKWIATASILDLNSHGKNPKLHHKKIILGRCGSFQKSYEENTHSFVARKQLNPSDLGHIIITMTPKVARRIYKDELEIEKQEEVTYIDLHGSI